MHTTRANDAEAFLDAMIHVDHSRLLQLLDSEVRWWVPPSAAAAVSRPLVGAAAAASLIGEPSTLFAPGTRRWTVHRIVADADMAAVHANLTARTTAGADYSNEYVLLLRFDDDQITEVWEHVDTAHFHAQIGPPEAASAAPSADVALAHAQIQTLLARYYQAIDSMDWDRLASDVLTDDAVWEVVQRTPSGVMEDRLEGRAQVLGWFRTMMEGAVTMSQGTCRHFITTTTIDVEGTTAHSVSHLLAADSITLALLANGVVTAEHVLTERGWRIRHYRVDEHITVNDMDALADTFAPQLDPS